MCCKWRWLLPVLQWDVKFCQKGDSKAFPKGRFLNHSQNFHFVENKGGFKVPSHSGTSPLEEWSFPQNNLNSRQLQCPVWELSTCSCTQGRLRHRDLQPVLTCLWLWGTYQAAAVCCSIWPMVVPVCLGCPRLEAAVRHSQQQPAVLEQRHGSGRPKEAAAEKIMHTHAHILHLQVTSPSPEQRNLKWGCSFVVACNCGLKHCIRDWERSL